MGLDLTYVITYHTSLELRNAYMQTLTASEARSNLYRLIDEAALSHEPIIISGKRADAVLLSAEDWSAIQETLYLLTVPGMRESIKAGMAEPLAKSAKALKW
jgi:antitoxin YefM